MMHTFRNLFITLAALAMLAAACGGSSDDGAAPTTVDADSTATTGESSDTTAATDTTEPTDPPTAPPGVAVPPADLTASWKGVSEDTIRLGFTVVDLVELKELGLVDLDRGDPQEMLDALVDEVNARGGINGRMIEAYLEIVNPIDATAAEAACLNFTSENEVFAVLSPFVGPNTPVNGCINDRNETIIVGGQATPEQLEAAKAPWISDSMFSTRRLEGVLTLMEAEDLLGDTVAVVVTAEEQATADDIVIPKLEEMGKTVVPAVQDIPPGDQVAGAAAWDVFIQKFISEDVDSVVMVENTATFGSSKLAASTLDAEFLIVDSARLVGGIGARQEVPLEDLEKVIGSSTASPEASWELPATQACVDVFEAAHPDIEVKFSEEVAEGESDYLGNINSFCPPLRLFELAATAAGADLTPETFLAGAESLGEIELPNQVLASMAPGKPDASDGLQLMQFDPTVGEFGGSKPYTEIIKID